MKSTTSSSVILFLTTSLSLLTFTLATPTTSITTTTPSSSLSSNPTTTCTHKDHHDHDTHTHDPHLLGIGLDHGPVNLKPLKPFESDLPSLGNLLTLIPTIPLSVPTGLPTALSGLLKDLSSDLSGATISFPDLSSVSFGESVVTPSSEPFVFTATTIPRFTASGLSLPGGFNGVTAGFPSASAVISAGPSAGLLGAFGGNGNSSNSTAPKSKSTLQPTLLIATGTPTPTPTKSSGQAHVTGSVGGRVSVVSGGWLIGVAVGSVIFGGLI